MRDIRTTRSIAYKRYMDSLGLDRLSGTEKMQMLWQTGWGEGWYGAAQEAKSRIKACGEDTPLIDAILDSMMRGEVDA